MYRPMGSTCLKQLMICGIAAKHPGRKRGFIRTPGIGAAEADAEKAPFNPSSDRHWAKLSGLHLAWLASAEFPGS